jgi:HAD superfamily hydrolase (TIGR02253 family)
MKAIIFDLDNTLIDFMRMKRISCSAAVEAMISGGLELDKEHALKILFELYDKHGIEYKGIFQEFLKKVSGKIDYKLLAEGIIAYRKAQTGYLEPYPNVIPTLIKLRERGMKLAIVSDAPSINAWLRLVEMKLHDFFDVVVTFDDTNAKKPSPLPFKKALEALKLEPKEVMMVGDWPERDIEGAKKLGMKACFAAYGNTSISCKEADYTINNISDLLKIVK